MRNKGIAYSAVLVVLLAAGLVHAQTAHLSDIVVTNTDEDLIVYFGVEGCFTPDMLRAIESGLPTTFTFYVNLYRKRDLWVDELIAEKELRHSVKYDPLKRRFEVRLTEREGEVLFVEGLQEVQRIMSEVAALKVAKLDDLKKGQEYQVRMRAELEKIRLPLKMHTVLFFLSLWDFETDWHTMEFVY